MKQNSINYFKKEKILFKMSANTAVEILNGCLLSIAKTCGLRKSSSFPLSFSADQAEILEELFT